MCEQLLASKRDNYRCRADICKYLSVLEAIFKKGQSDGDGCSRSRLISWTQMYVQDFHIVGHSMSVYQDSSRNGLAGGTNQRGTNQ
jgi:hypothetical protein